MRGLFTVILVLLVPRGMVSPFLPAAAAQARESAAAANFAGTWKLNASRSQQHDLPVGLPETMRVEQGAAALTISSATPPVSAWKYPLDGGTQTRRQGDLSLSTKTKWEGAALLVNTLVTGAQNFTLMERWRLSRDGRILTIVCTTVRRSGETESTLVYENAAMEVTGSKPPELPARREETRVEVARVESSSSVEVARVEESQVEVARVENGPARVDDTRVSVARVGNERGSRAGALPIRDVVPLPEYVVESGTRILLKLTNSLSTKHAAPGDKVYLETAVPVYVNEHLVVPVGSYVTGVITESKPAGKGKNADGVLNVQFQSLTLPNGVSRDFRARASSADESGNLDKTEGQIRGEPDKKKGGVADKTMTGARIGSLGGVTGAGAGAAAGAIVGLAGKLKGSDVILPPGTTMEMVLERDVTYTAGEIVQ